MSNDKSGVIPGIVNIFQIIAAVAGVLSLCLASVVAVYAIRNPNRVEQIIYIISGSTPVPSNEVVITTPLAQDVATKIPTIAPTKAPTIVPTVDPTLFRDDFNLSLQDDWGFKGNYGLSNGKLVITESVVESQIIGDSNWVNYDIVFEQFDLSDSYLGLVVQVFVRASNYNNSMLLYCYGWANWTYTCEWNIVTNGNKVVVPGTSFDIRRDELITRIEVNGNVYRTYVNGELMNYFVDNSFTSGGFGLKVDGNLTLDGIVISTVQ